MFSEMAWNGNMSICSVPHKSVPVFVLRSAVGDSNNYLFIFVKPEPYALLQYTQPIKTLNNYN